MWPTYGVVHTTDIHVAYLRGGEHQDIHVAYLRVVHTMYIHVAYLRVVHTTDIHVSCLSWWCTPQTYMWPT